MTEKLSWPNDGYWSALADGAVITVDETPYHLSVVDCGELALPTGRLVALDPFVYLEKTNNPYVEVAPGRYPVKVTLADVSGQGDGSHLREAYATLILADRPEVHRKLLCPLLPGEEAPELKPNEFVGFAVDAGTACFVDAGAIEACMPDSEDWAHDFFENEDPKCWFRQMDDPEHIRAGIANITLPLAKAGENLVLFHSGWGDGFYPVVGGYDAAGELVRVHIDFLVVGETSDEDGCGCGCECDCDCEDGECDCDCEDGECDCDCEDGECEDEGCCCSEKGCCKKD